jgi:cell division transport system permease protein
MKMREDTMLRRIWNRVNFAAGSAWQNFWRNAAVSVASVLIVWVVLLSLGSLLLILHSLDQIVAMEKTRASVISVYLADTDPLSSVMDFKLHLDQDPRVTAVQYVTKDEAMARFRQMPALDPSVIESLGTNPLPASLDVTVRDIRDLGAIDQEVRNSPLVDKSPATNYEPSVIDKIILLARVMGIAGLALIIGLTGLSVFIIMLTIRTAIYLRRKEIEVMKLVGATDWFVRWPFIVEGLIVGVAGAVFAVLIVGLGYRPAVQNLQSVLIFIPLSYDPHYLQLTLLAMLTFGLLLGTVGSYLGVRRFLKS